MSDSAQLGLKEPENLTGKVVIDKNEGEFWGNYSCVYLGRYRSELVAVKIIQRTGHPESMKRKVKRETMVWATTDHPNILPFYGFADDDAFAPFGALISPWCTKGDASRYLSEHGETVSFNDRTNLWKGVIKGVAYLHAHKPVIIHGDLKPGNILIDDSGTPRICDFGLARIFLQQGHTDLTTTSEHTGTTRYLAPELVSSEEPVLPAPASDIYALACIGLELIYGQKPYANRANNSRGQIYVDLRKGLPPAGQRPSGEWPSCQAWPLITEMWNINPHCRPLAFTIPYTLDRILFTLPLTVVQRIIYFSATILGPRGGEVNMWKWVGRCDLLRSLCLVSRACRDSTLPFLYGKIRLELPGGYASMAHLVKTLACTEGQVNTLNPVFTAYGRLVKTVILVTEFKEVSPQSTEFFLDLWSLLQMMPEMRCVLISHSEYLDYPISIHPMSTLEIRGPSSSLGEKIILQALPWVQRLSIMCRWEALTPLYDAHISSDTFFPNLQAINIKHATQIGSDFVKTLDVMSGWIMPRLTSLRISCTYFSLPVRAKILAFLGAHGHTIQDLAFVPPSTHDMPFSEVLSQCPKLRSLIIVTSEFSLPNDFPRHLYLERIVILGEAPGSGNSTSFTPYFLQIEGFKRLSSAMFPKLDIAEFKWSDWAGWINGTTKVSAFFKAGTDAIIINGKSLYRSPIWPLPSLLSPP